jgi:hypothetical protein
MKVETRGRRDTSGHGPYGELRQDETKTRVLSPVLRHAVERLNYHAAVGVVGKCEGRDGKREAGVRT